MAKRAAARPPRSRRLLPGAGVAGLVLLAALDVVLVIAALDHVKATPVADGSPAAASSAAPAARTSPSRDASASSDAGAGTPVPEGPLLLALAPDGTLLRTTEGGCTDESDPQVAVSTDQGVTFKTLSVAKDLDGVMALEAKAADDLGLVGADADCTAQVYSGTARRDTWDVESKDQAWHLTGGGDDTVHAPSGVVETPCTPQALSTVNAVRLLCTNGAVLGTADDGDSWATLGRLANVSAMAFEGPSRGYALQERRNCPVAAMTTNDGGASWEFSACLDGSTGRAVAARGDVVTALVDDQVFRSEDGGDTWSRVG